jgi:hypothetical protein
MTPSEMRSTVRRLIRESVRARFGLLSEAKSVAVDKKGLKADGPKDNLVITNGTGQPIYGVNLRGSDSKTIASYFSQDNLFAVGAQVTLPALASAPGTVFALGVKTPDETFSVDLDFTEEAAAPAPEPAATGGGAGAAGAGAETGQPQLGMMGEYKNFNGTLVLNPRETTVLAVEKNNTNAYTTIKVNQGELINIPIDDMSVSHYIYRVSDLKDPNGVLLKPGSSYDAFKNEKINAFVDQTKTEPPPMPQAAAASSGGTGTQQGQPTTGGASSGAAAQSTAAEKKTTYASDPTFEKMDPHGGASTVQEKIRIVASAVRRNFEDVTDEPAEMLTIEEVEAEPSNILPDHTWITNSEADRQPFGLADWSGQWGDPYTYFALVNNETKEPICFVVASDPQENKHWSTGRFIGPDSKRQNLRRAFCYLFHRATGRVHDTCLDGPTEKPDDDVPKGSGGRGGRGKGGAAGTGSSVATGASSLSVKMRGTDIVRGKGDPQARFLRSVALERVSKGGIKFYTRAKTRFDAMGPGGTPTPAILKMGQKANGKDPITLVVTFKNPVNIETTKVVENPDGSQRKMLMLTTLSPNKGPEDIESIGFYYKKGAAWFRENAFGLPRSPGSALKKLTAENDPEAFAAAANWVFSNPQEFDLGEDIEFRSPEGAGAGARGPSTAEQHGDTQLGEAAIRRARSTMSVTPLFDRYRF